MNDLKIFDDFKLKAQIQISWADMDIFGHVNSSKYFAYFETARIKYYENLGFLDYFKLNNIAGVLSKIDCSYLIPLVYPDMLTVGARVTEIYEYYMIMEYFIKSNMRGLSAIGESEIVFYNFMINKKIPIPEKIHKGIMNFENI